MSNLELELFSNGVLVESILWQDNINPNQSVSIEFSLVTNSSLYSNNMK